MTCPEPILAFMDAARRRSVGIPKSVLVAARLFIGRRKFWRSEAAPVLSRRTLERPSRADACKGSEDWIMAKIFRFLTPAAAWSLFAFIAYATLSPLDERPEIDGFLYLFSHFDHYIAYATMGCLFGWAYPRQTFLVCILVLGGAVLLELAQLLTPDRHARVLDATRKIIGGTIGIAFAHLGSRFVARRIISCLQKAHENE